MPQMAHWELGAALPQGHEPTNKAIRIAPGKAGVRKDQGDNWWPMLNRTEPFHIFPNMMAGRSFFQIRSPHKLLYTVLVVVLASENIYLGTDNIYKWQTECDTEFVLGPLRTGLSMVFSSRVAFFKGPMLSPWMKDPLEYTIVGLLVGAPSNINQNLCAYT